MVTVYVFFSSGYCLEIGLGTKPDMSKAVEFYTIDATQFGNFDSIKNLGGIYMEVRVCVKYLKFGMKCRRTKSFLETNI